MNHLSLRGVSKNFGGVQALSNVSFDVRPGEIVGLMGANGAGKTTLFNLITGHIPASGGQILLRGQPLAGLRPDQICRLGVGRTFQIVKPFPRLTVADNLLTAALFGRIGLRDRKQAMEHCAGILEDLALAHCADMPASELTLSGQKRLELARALCGGSDLILLDEVMAGLTPPEVQDMLDVIARLQSSRNLTIVIIEHVMRALMTLSDRIVVLHLGEVLLSGTPDDIASDPRVHDVYFGAEQ
ncbi:ABC transporter ATP-binding protein [Pusillimonas noertemannii]|uniref:Amino acid/amide ABC transporter ATP-binding protein 1 (HAAT family) n=1 Tax=Pusillimonas noertemannii TaxID=305977 RepID=A0A2U1CNK7_9BURK|nr:ABC transporter ATP-binding protein [Pusillimonas noertemannii]NYT68378.1 ABC transporter ATP-binding protein [Pusillimonas noertemannii]PVY62606.1 amino acid/amide ABC transporter ATP-binding protein 1 (HAAT family) [Pusillimonas noertemannii]TFL10448.1 ABC transporter ATP-binding protein [Pusillimonas noertemannii]